MSGIYYDNDGQNDHVLRGTGLYTIDLTTGLPVYLDGTSTVEATLLDSAGEEIDGTTWPVTLSYITGSQGDVIGVIPRGLTLPADRLLLAQIDIDAGTDQHARFTRPVPIQERSW